MLGGFLIDADHVVDQFWAIRQNAPHTRQMAAASQAPMAPSVWRRWYTRYLRRRKLLRLPLVLHSYELWLLLLVVTLLMRSPLLLGLAAGYSLHLALDIWRHYHEFRSPLFYSLLYRMRHGFRRQRLIKEEYL